MVDIPIKSEQTKQNQTYIYTCIYTGGYICIHHLHHGKRKTQGQSRMMPCNVYY